MVNERVLLHKLLRTLSFNDDIQTSHTKKRATGIEINLIVITLQRRVIVCRRIEKEKRNDRT